MCQLLVPKYQIFRQLRISRQRHIKAHHGTKRGTNKTIKAVVPSRQPAVVRVSVDALAAIPEESVWLESRKSARTRPAYRVAVAHFMRTFHISSPEELRKIDHRAVMAWERLMREEEKKEASTVRRRLAALSSLFTQL